MKKLDYVNVVKLIEVLDDLVEDNFYLGLLWKCFVISFFWRSKFVFICGMLFWVLSICIFRRLFIGILSYLICFWGMMGM